MYTHSNSKRFYLAKSQPLLTSVRLSHKQLIFVHTLKELFFSGKVTTSAYLHKSLTPSAGLCTHTQTQRFFFLAKSQPLLISVRLSLKQLIFVHTLKVVFSWQSHNTCLLLYVSQLVFMHTLKELGFFWQSHNLCLPPHVSHSFSWSLYTHSNSKRLFLAKSTASSSHSISAPTNINRQFLLQSKSQPLLTSVRLSLKQLTFVHTLKEVFSWQNHNTYLLLYISHSNSWSSSTH